MENLWKSVILAEEVIKFLPYNNCYMIFINEYVNLYLQNSPKTFHHYQDNIDYRDKIVVKYRDIGFTIMAQP